MTRSRLTRRLARSVCALAALACISLAIAAAATARSPTPGPSPSFYNSPAPIVKETVLQPADGGPDTLALVLIGIGAAAALLGAGYLGVRIATRTVTPTHRGPASRTGI